MSEVEEKVEQNVADTALCSSNTGTAEPKLSHFKCFEHNYGFVCPSREFKTRKEKKIRYHLLLILDQISLADHFIRYPNMILLSTGSRINWHPVTLFFGSWFPRIIKTSLNMQMLQKSPNPAVKILTGRMSWVLFHPLLLWIHLPCKFPPSTDTQTSHFTVCHIHTQHTAASHAQGMNHIMKKSYRRTKGARRVLKRAHSDEQT